MSKPRDLSQAMELIKSFEGLADGDPTTVNLDPYLCPAGYWTIGWGHVVLDPRGKRVKGAANKAPVRSIYPNGITKGEAEVLLTDDVRRFSVGVEQLLEVTVSDAKFCALLSFTFNVGVGALRCSTLLRLINRGDFVRAASQFLQWTKAGGKELAGLKRRREAERRLWVNSGFN